MSADPSRKGLLTEKCIERGLNLSSTGHENSFDDSCVDRRESFLQGSLLLRMGKARPLRWLRSFFRCSSLGFWRCWDIVVVKVKLSRSGWKFWRASFLLLVSRAPFCAGQLTGFSWSAISGDEDADSKLAIFRW